MAQNLFIVAAKRVPFGAFGGKLKHLTANELGGLASKAAVGNALHRNRAKRRLRELFRAHQGRLPAHCDFLLIARAAAYDRPFAELEKNFLQACGQLATAAKPAPHA